MQLPLFRTPVDVPAPSRPLSYRTPFTCIGSCFAEEIGGRLVRAKFPCDVNPFGVLYNPLAIADALERLVSGIPFTQADLEFDGERWFSFAHHGRFSRRDPETCLRDINRRLGESAEHLGRASHLSLTFGTAWVYALRETGRAVANCHRQPASRFTRFLQTSDQIVATYAPLAETLRTLNPNLELVFTVSPVRHWKDGASGNQLSKATLAVAVHQLVETCAPAGYFPAYEIVMDELRDYRFYAEDMLHIAPSGAAYIWERFADAYVDDEGKRLIPEIDKLLAAISHHPTDPASPGYQTFLDRTLRQLDDLESRHPFLNMQAERELLISRKTP